VSSRWSTFLLIGVLAATVGGLAFVYQLRLRQGDSFPDYASMRADPRGTRVLFDSLSALPNVQVTRRLEPLEDLARLPQRTLFLLGVELAEWRSFDPKAVEALDRAVRAGSRVVIALHSAGARSLWEDRKKKESTEGAKKSSAEKPDTDKPEANPEAKKVVEAIRKMELGGRWGISVDTGLSYQKAERQAAASPEWPTRIRWGSQVFFTISDPSAWKVFYSRDNRPVLIERSLGAGSVVLSTDAYPLSNEALQQERSTPLLSWLVGGNSTIEFQESHLGLRDDPGLAQLARRYGLAGAFVALVIAALLLCWQRMVLFVPPAPRVDEVSLKYQQTAGLQALLQRAVTPARLAEACVAEWRRTARPADIARVDTALKGLPKRSGSRETYNALVRALRRR
jgi:hypothetical protein